MGPDLDLIRAALPGYEVGGEIGRGGWGVVLQAEHRALGRRAAIKQLLWERFTSPAGVRADAACALTLAVCSALDATHRVGVLHRDLKPENVLFNLRGVPKLSDFGVAKVLGATKRRTMVGEILGTPAYMSPEHAQGRAVGPEADIYSLGVMLYELLAGRLPFDDEDPVALLVSHASAEPEPVTQLADVPEPIGDVVMQALGSGLAPRQRDPPSRRRADRGCRAPGVESSRPADVAPDCQAVPIGRPSPSAGRTGCCCRRDVGEHRHLHPRSEPWPECCSRLRPWSSSAWWL